MTKLSVGTKYDDEKDRWSLLPLRPLKEIVKVFTGGARKYDSWNWHKGIEYSRLYNSAMRHMNDWWSEGKTINDQDFGLHHLAHCAWNIIILLYFELYPKKYKKFDDRVLMDEED